MRRRFRRRLDVDLQALGAAGRKLCFDVDALVAAVGEAEAIPDWFRRHDWWRS